MFFVWPNFRGFMGCPELCCLPFIDPVQLDNTTYCDFKADSEDNIKGCRDTHHTLADHDREWLLCTHPPMLIFQEASMCIIKPYWPSIFAHQFGYTQSRIRAPRLYPIQEGSVIDGSRSWVNFSRRDTHWHFLYSLASGHHGKCILCYWEWLAQALRDFFWQGGMSSS